MSDPIESGVKPETKTVDELLSSLSPDARKVFEETQKGLLSALQKEREAHSDASKKAEALEKAQQEADRKRLEESQEYKKLYETTLADLTSIKPKAEQVDTYEKTLAAILAAQIEELPEDFRDVVPDGLSTQAKLDWLAKNKSKFMKAEPFDIGAGKRGTKPDKHAELTPEELQIAKRAGLTPEEYAKFK
jgi:hypothetical protein